MSVSERVHCGLIAVRVWSLPVDWPPSPMGYHSDEDLAEQAQQVVRRARHRHD
jgi:hypothetical protein